MISDMKPYINRSPAYHFQRAQLHLAGCELCGDVHLAVVRMLIAHGDGDRRSIIIDWKLSEARVTYPNTPDERSQIRGLL
jgi:hypothetical protein